MVGPTLSVFWQRLGGALAVALCGLIAAGFPASRPSGPTLVLVGLTALVVGVLWSAPARLAWFAGFLLLIQQVDDVSINVPEVLSIVVILLTALVYRPDLPRRSRPIVMCFVGLLAIMVLLNLAFGLVRDPLGSTLRFNGLYALTVASAGLFAFRTSAYRPMLMGHLAGSALTSTVSIWQSAGLDLLRVANHGDGRYPGLALEAPGVSWQTAVALLVGVYALRTTTSNPWRWATLGAMLVCGLGMVVCGAQGGLLGLGAAVLVSLAFAWRQFDHRLVLRAVGGGAVLLTLIVFVASLAGFGMSSLSGVAGDAERGYENERARARAVRYGLEQFGDNPLAGIGTAAYDARYEVRPHVVPLNLSVNTGILGLLVGTALMALLGWTVIRGPADRGSPQSWLGVAILATVLVQASLTPAGPFAKIERIVILLLAVVMAKGGASAMDSAVDGVEPTPRSVESDASPDSGQGEKSAPAVS